MQAPTGAIGVGPLSGASVGLGLSVGFEHTGWQLQLQGLAWKRQNVPASGFPGYGADVGRISGRFWACHETRLLWLGLSPCLVGGMERVSVSGTGNNIVSTTRHTIGASAGAGIQGRIRLASWIRVLAAVGGEIELVRPQISIDGLGQLAPSPTDPPTPIYRFAPAALTATLSLEWVL